VSLSISAAVAFHDLDFEQAMRDRLQLVPLFGQDPPRGVVRVAQDALDLAVDLLSRFLAVESALGRHPDVEEASALVHVIVDGAHLVAHAPLGDHRARHVGGALQIVLRAGRDLPECNFLCRAPPEQDSELDCRDRRAS
jgi:hypothetical protein